MRLQVIGVEGLPFIKDGDDLAELVVAASKRQGTPLENGDVLVLCHVIVSKAEGRTIDLKLINPSEIANSFSMLVDKDPRLVEVILRDSMAIRRMAPGVLITETKQGFVCANAGVDKSNIPGDDIVAPLPADPDVSARRIRERIGRITGASVAVIIADTHGRAHRDGEVNVAVGASGLQVIRDRRGERDLFGYELKVKRTAVADELAAAAELVIGQADEGVPAAIIRGYKYIPSEESTARELVRPREKDLFL
jgi:coenzyme F420-0:L-glutamate ligase/coenzyme F420-1:gamma-L-glutamate ligase